MYLNLQDVQIVGNIDENSGNRQAVGINYYGIYFPKDIIFQLTDFLSKYDNSEIGNCLHIESEEEFCYGVVTGDLEDLKCKIIHHSYKFEDAKINSESEEPNIHYIEENGEVTDVHIGDIVVFNEQIVQICNKDQFSSLYKII